MVLIVARRDVSTISHECTNPEQQGVSDGLEMRQARSREGKMNMRCLF